VGGVREGGKSQVSGGGGGGDESKILTAGPGYYEYPLLEHSSVHAEDHSVDK